MKYRDPINPLRKTPFGEAAGGGGGMGNVVQFGPAQRARQMEIDRSRIPDAEKYQNAVQYQGNKQILGKEAPNADIANRIDALYVKSTQQRLSRQEKIEYLGYTRMFPKYFNPVSE